MFIDGSATKAVFKRVSVEKPQMCLGARETSSMLTPTFTLPQSGGQANLIDGKKHKVFIRVLSRQGVKPFGI